MNERNDYTGNRYLQGDEKTFPIFIKIINLIFCEENGEMMILM
jgi:hypothetical protein